MNDSIDYLKRRAQSERLFGAVPLASLLQQQGNGFHRTEGFHIYCELRPKTSLEFDDDDAKALKFVQIIEEYTNHGVRAAIPFRVALLELQGTVLHFYKEGGLNRASVIEALQFIFLFTTALYEELKPELGEDWQGFASCIDHGPAILIRHDSVGSASVVSLGPAANRPAKRLLYGRTAAGCVDVPIAWAKTLGARALGDWYSINLRDRNTFPFVAEMENAVLRQQLLDRIREFRMDANRRRVSAIAKANRFNGFCIQADLDGFSPIVERAFGEGPKAIEQVAMGFAQILEFGDYMRHSTPGSRGLPWAGDRAPTLVPKSAWLDFSMRWQGFAAGTNEGRARGWANVFKDVAWAVGGCHGKTGSNIVVPIEAQGRKFEIAAGWPVAQSMEAQNCGSGGDLVTHALDYDEFDGATRKLFSQILGTEFWRSRNLAPQKITQSAVEAGKSRITSPGDYQSQHPSIHVPRPRPYRL